MRGGVKFLRAFRVANSRQLPEWTKVLQRDREFYGRLQKLPTSYVQLTNPAFPKLWSNETPSRRRCMTIRIRCPSKQGKSPLLGGAGTVLGQRCQHSWSTSTRVYDAWQRSAVQKPVLSLSVFPLIHLASRFKTAIPACYYRPGQMRAEPSGFCAARDPSGFAPRRASAPPFA